ncbi:MAG: ATP-binding protein [Deltaproteobacteria bacterium]|jgi:hypothetical protein|nr:ATP-binding protein [Deltaproteobacteria bacterium]
MANADGPDILKIGRNIANFSELREESYVYVDKTDFVHKLLTDPDKRLFLSRPRRFGKTLLIDTLEEAAIGRKELFSGLAIDRLRNDNEWPRSHVLRISMNSFGDDPALLDRSLTEYLHSFARKRGFSISAHYSANSLLEVIDILFDNFDNIPIVTQSIHRNNNLVADQSKIIVLVDEYDAPIINNITNPAKLDIAKQTLHEFYNTLKSCGKMIDRVFITGITKFAQLSVFSAINNLVDITFEPKYTEIFGFTIGEICKYYSPHLDIALAWFHKHKEFGSGFTRKMLIGRIVEWYDGYSWNGTDRVINPLSLQNLLLDRKFDNFWFRTGGINFLQKLNIRDDIFSKAFAGNEKFSGSVDIQDAGDIDPIALMLQTGYLTLSKRKKSDEFSKLYLTVPNREVGMSIMKNYVDRHIIPIMSAEKDIFNPIRTKEFCHAFCQGQSERAEELLHGFLSVIPHSLHAQTEFLCRVILLSIFKMSDFEVDPEHNIAGGIVDLVITAPDNTVLITEIKYAKSDNEKDVTSSSPVSANLPPGISAQDNKKMDSCIRATFRQIIKKGYLLPYVVNKNPVRAVAVAVCGRTHVRIRSCTAAELLQSPHEFIKLRKNRKPRSDGSRRPEN